jgi:hypothetical protein
VESTLFVAVKAKRSDLPVQATQETSATIANEDDWRLVNSRGLLVRAHLSAQRASEVEIDANPGEPV